MIPAQVWLALQQLGGGPVYDALGALARMVSGASTANLVVYPNRYDLSVNSARVENASSLTPSMITGTSLNAAGGFFGGGVGNKALLGFKGHSGLPLGQLQSVSWEWENVSLIETPPGLFLFPYLNLQLELSPGQYKIFSVDPNIPAGQGLNLGTLTSLGPNRWRFTHVSTNFVQVVNAFSAQVAAPPVPAMPIVSTMPLCQVPVPIAAGPLPVSPGDWPGNAFRYSDILAAFPGATLIDVYTGDRGLPGGSTATGANPAVPTPAVALTLGQSSFRIPRNLRLGPVLLNGQPA